jgi:hypothetical protein
MNETKVNTNIGDMPSHVAKKASTSPGSVPMQTSRPEPYHQYDNWLVPQAKNNPDALFASQVLDISRGSGVIVRILAAHLLDLNVIASGGGDSTYTLLSENDTEALARLAAFSLSQLHEMATNHVERLNSKAEAEVRV